MYHTNRESSEQHRDEKKRRKVVGRIINCLLNMKKNQLLKTRREKQKWKRTKSHPRNLLQMTQNMVVRVNIVVVYLRKPQNLKM